MLKKKKSEDRKETFSDMQNLKNNLFPMHLFTGREGVRQE